MGGWYIYLIYHTIQLNVDKYTNPVNPVGYVLLECSIKVLPNNILITGIMVCDSCDDA